MSETPMLDKLERLAGIIQKLEGLAERIPRLAEMLGVAMFAGKASERLGGGFAAGALGGVVADGLAHSNLSHNQLGGVALAAYFSALGVLNMAPPSISTNQPVNNTPEGFQDVTMPLLSCVTQGGEAISRTLFGSGASNPNPMVVCRLPLPVPFTGDIPGQATTGQIRR